MKEEIKDILNDLKDSAENPSYTEIDVFSDEAYEVPNYFTLDPTNGGSKTLLEYIENLQSRLKGIQEERDYLFNKLSIENKFLQSQLKAKEEVIKEARETIKTKLQKSFAYDYGLSGVDATGKDRLFTETVIELQLIDKILSKGENNG